MAMATTVGSIASPPAQCCAPLTAKRMSARDRQVAAELFKALSDPHRIGIVNLLATSQDAVCVCDVTDAIGLSQPTISFHLKKLVNAGLVDREQRGTWAYYSLNRAAFDRLSDVFESDRRGGVR